MTKPLQIVTLCPGWDSSAGGVATLNRELSIALAEQGHHVTARVANPAEAHALVHVQVVEPPAGHTERTALALQPERLPKDVDVIVGHTRFSGPAAQELKKRYPNAVVVNFTHMNIEELDRYRGSPEESHQHFVTERDLIEGADVAVGVGPLLYDEAARMAQMSPKPKVVTEFIPGIRQGTAVTKGPHQGPVSLYMVGRTDDPLKGVLVAGQAAKLLRQRGIESTLTVRGSKLTGKALAEATARLERVAGVPVSILPFSTNPQDLADDLARADIALMPSTCEGWGLVAAEAAGYGVPVVASADSGFGRFMMSPERMPPELSQGTVVPLQNGRVTGEALADTLETVCSDLDRHKALALERRGYLLEHYSAASGAAALVTAFEAARANKARTQAQPAEAVLGEPKRASTSSQELAPTRRGTQSDAHPAETANRSENRTRVSPSSARYPPAVNVVSKYASYVHLVADSNDPLASTVAAAVGELTKKGQLVKLSIREQALSSTPHAHEPALRSLAGSMVRVLPATADPAETCADLRGADLVVLPRIDWAVGLLAIQLGVPLLTSMDRDLGRMIADVAPAALMPEPIPRARGGEIPVNDLSLVLEDGLANRLELRSRAIKLRDHVLRESHLALFDEALGWLEQHAERMVATFYTAYLVPRSLQTNPVFEPLAMDALEAEEDVFRWVHTDSTAARRLLLSLNQGSHLWRLSDLEVHHALRDAMLSAELMCIKVSN